MKLWAGILLALIAGYILGGWPHQSELLRMEQQIQALEKKLAAAGSRKSSLGGIGRMLNVPEAAPTESAGDFDDIPDPTLDPEPATDDPEPAGEEGDEAEEVAPDEEDDFEAQIEKAVALWRVRSDLARGAMLHQLDASDEDTLRIDVVLEAMNVRLAATIQKWADVLAAETMPNQEAGIRMMNEITAAMAITYDELDRNLEEGWKTDVGDTFELTDFIDPSVALPLADVEDKLDFE